MILISKCLLILFGLFIILAGFLMLFNPNKALATLRKAGSTNFINYTEITIRLIIACALIIYSNHALYPEYFKLLGWFMLATSLILYAVPRQRHHNFSLKCAEIIKPLYFRIISPFAFLFGGLIIYNSL